MAKKGGLGRGIGALISESYVEAAAPEVEGAVVTLPVEKIHRNECQPRLNFDEDALRELEESIRQVGVLQPILVRPDGEGYQIIAGERRYQASRRAGLTEVPVVIREIDDDGSLELALIENIQRSDLNSIEEARAYRELLDRTKVTQEELAKRLGKSRSAVTNALRLLDLPDEIQVMLFEGLLTAGHARCILAVPTLEKRLALAQKVVNEKLSVRQTESLVPLFSVETDEKPVRQPLPSTFKRVARQLRDELATNVKIKQARGKYKIEIEFADEEDLGRILDVIATKEG